MGGREGGLLVGEILCGIVVEASAGVNLKAGVGRVGEAAVEG